MQRLIFVLALSAISFGLPHLASADPPSPSEGVPLPDSSIVTPSDSTSLELNPAGLGYIHGFEAGYAAFLPHPDYQGVIPSGHALTIGAGTTSAGIGLGLQRMEHPRLGPGLSSFRKFTLGTALSPSPFLSIGGNINFFGSRTDERMNSLRTTDIGLQLRPSSRFGIGLIARDVRPAFLREDWALPRRYGAGVALRALEGRLVLDTELQHVHGSDAFRIKPRLAGEPLSGIRIFGHTLFEVPMPDGDIDPGFTGMSVGMEISTGTSGIQASSQFGRFGGADATAPTGLAYRLWTGTPQKRPLIEPRGRWVRLELDDSVAEQSLTRLFGMSTRAFLDVVNDIDAITQDASVEGVVLDIGRIDLGYAQLWELHRSLDELHRAGKQSIAIIDADISSTRIAYASAAAQEVWMRPSTPYGPTGLHVEMNSYAGLLVRAGIEAEFMRIGEYKSAPESFVLPHPSEPAREQTGAYLDAIYAELTETVAARRGLDTEEFQDIIDHTPVLPAEALDRGLIDVLAYGDEMEEKLRRRTGRRMGAENGYQRHEIADQRWGTRPEIAVVYIDGVITSGESGHSPFGSTSITGAETIAEILQRLRRDDNVKAVVVRIDSPGGSAFGSDVIYREMRHLATRKPVIASMGNVAASGGYYAAAGADEIFATPVSLTGSIGIYAGKFNVESLADRIGITTHQKRRGERAGAFSTWTPWTESERQGLAKSLNFMYELFLQQVARTRPLDPSEVDDVARGRVWTGEDAQQRDLVDTVGGISDALSRAEQLAGLAPSEAVYTDRTGDAGTMLSPGISTGVQKLLSRFGIVDDSDVVRPTGQFSSAVQQMESALLWPLYFDATEAVFMSPYHTWFH